MADMIIVIASADLLRPGVNSRRRIRLFFNFTRPN